MFEQAHLESAMKDVGAAFAAGGVALAKNDIATAKLQFLHAREELAPTIAFWRHRKKDDAVKMLRAVLARLDAIDTVLSTPPVDAAASRTTADQAGAACQACHDVYREHDPATNVFRLKPGVVQ